MEVHKEIDNCRQEVLCRVGEECLRPPFLLTATLVQGSQQGSRRFRCCRQVRNVLALNRIDAVRILYIRKVDGTKTTVLRQSASLPVLAILIEKRLGECRVFEVIYHHREPLGCMLTDERINDTEGLTRTRCTQYNRPTERIDDVDPALVHFLLPVVNHRDVHRIVIGYQSLRLLERFVLEVEAVFTHLVVIVFGDAVQSLMYQHGTHYRAECIEDAVGREAKPTHADIHAVKDKAHPDQCQSCQHRIDDHRLDIELQCLLCLGSDTDHTDADQLCHLAARYGIEHLESAQQVQDKLRHTVIRRDGKIHHNLDDEKDVDATAEVVVHLLLFPGFFECHCYCI